MAFRTVHAIPKWPPPLLLRQPARVWLPLGLVLAPVIGTLPFAAVLAVWVSQNGAASRLVLDASAFMAGSGVIAALAIGLPWAAVTRRRQRRLRLDIMIEASAVALAFLAFFVTAAAALRFGERLVFGATIAEAARPAYGILFWVSAYGFAVVCLIAPLAGFTLSWVAFRRTPTPLETRPPSTP